ncbi:MAG: hypothetical protein A3B86_02585 [Candidatus Yanofskybacteria bacterium RIFCSPHIGHO2_02_FULL_38_22b]|uniref:ChbG/HpnK family deacetylase n=1 Tax=Candidatus Yanofskybacteria bacterium RIFCSPHIGHO2_02_FULL_38_22b TaxID=1802673 RepID=A0A1F8F3N2_9BACT|nr:MAG: hypothetical protein A2816_03270 [Candidatus Yanofskybacteria bacterium RIFCSPHIGHO2_01_FULL_39_44]OGN07742.1 MAG: hypothetical protein A3B86_02585 [Candidatus Yanofskybacteria bacterium RIFCSPHIGHO2_02_FULL_38_22b]OGN20624.1 MAG: hypothetical protein A2910_02420 [Candidatus Yanofskybacteria bacterium RIFCSPLOWO2_01_FULL_39_28]
MLKIIADDLGLHKSVNDGIIFLLKEGKIDGASLMPNGEAFEDAVRQYSEAKIPSEKIGIHLNLVEQKSVFSGRLMPKNHKILFIKYILGLVKKDYIQKEFEAQFKKVIQAGIKPFFINGNQHLHLLPGIMDITIKLAKEYGIKYIRIVNEPVSLRKCKLFRQFQLMFLNFLSKLAENKIKKAGLKCNDYFIGFINAGNLREADIKQACELAKIHPDKIVELGSHPGYEDESLRRQYKHWGNYNWQKELDLLK